jgi:hypothetical protein
MLPGAGRVILPVRTHGRICKVVDAQRTQGLAGSCLRCFPHFNVVVSAARVELGPASSQFGRQQSRRSQERLMRQGALALSEWGPVMGRSDDRDLCARARHVTRIFQAIARGCWSD